MDAGGAGRPCPEVFSLRAAASIEPSGRRSGIIRRSMSKVVESSSSRLDRMIRQQVIDRGITDERVIDALRSVPREKFFQQDLADEAYADRAAPIGHGQTISQPYMV